jgi:hypothetical protein
MKILFVMDSAYKDAHVKALRLHGHECHTAETLSEAEELISSNAYDLTLLVKGTSIGRKNKYLSLYSVDTPAVRTFLDLHRSELKEVLLFSFFVDDPGYLYLMDYADTKDFLALIERQI